MRRAARGDGAVVDELLNFWNELVVVGRCSIAEPCGSDSCRDCGAAGCDDPPHGDSPSDRP